MSKSIESSPNILPAGYRLRYRFVLFMEVAGRYRFCEQVPVVQRFTEDPRTPFYDHQWHDVGFLDELRQEGGLEW